MTHRPRTTRRAVLLLEVVIALTIMVMTLSVLSGQLTLGLRTSDEADERTRAIQFADRLMALLQLDPVTIERFLQDPEIDGDFGEEHLGWFWRTTVEPTDVPGLGQLTIEILRQRDPELLDSIEGARVIKTVHILKAAPQPIDLVKDFGISAEQAAFIGENVPYEELDPTNFDPQALAQLINEDTLLELLPILMPLIQQLTGGQGLPEGAGADVLAGLLGGAGGADGLPPEIAGLLGGLTGGAGGSGPGGGRGGGEDGGGANPRDAAIRSLIEGALGDQVSPEELDELMNNLNNERDGGSGKGSGGTPR